MKKKIIIITIALVLILLILFVPIKIQYRDGGTVDYRAFAYRLINWNKLKEDGTYYKAKDIIFFPNNFHSIEYYEPIEVPNTYVSVNTQQNNEASSQNDEETIELPNAYVTSNNTEIHSLSGSAHWSKEVDGETISAIFDSIDPRDGNYNENIAINNKQSINIKTNYTVTSVEIQSIDKNDNNKYEVQYNEEAKNITFNSIEDGTYVVTYKIENDKDYVYYSFKVIIKN